MDSLLGYGSSSSDSDEETRLDKDTQSKEAIGGGTEADNSTSGVNFLAGEGVGSDSEEEDQGEQIDSETYNKARDYINSKSAGSTNAKLPSPLVTEKLPAPNLGKKLKSTLHTKEKDSVFVTSYQKDEQAKLSVLEKHVKVTALPTGKHIHGKQVCWLYRKGQCRKGHRCKFAHDNDLITEAPPKTDNPESSHNNQNTGHQSKSKSGSQSFALGAGYFHSQHVTPEPVDEDSYMGSAKRKCRPGINDLLRPNKKSMAMLEKQRATERPWTVNK